MRIKYIASIFEIIFKYLGIVVLFPILVSFYYHEFASIIPFLTASFISFGLSLILRIFTRGLNNNINDIKKNEGLFIVAASWITACIIAAVPYLFYGMTPIDALFEAASGITTTGASICSGVDYPRTAYFWRSFTQWLGGMGIIVLFIAILPQLAVAGRQMFFAELPGPTEEKFTPRIRNTASALWKIYAILTAVEMIILKCLGMPMFDAVCNSLSTLSAGGFSPNSHSIMGYHSIPIVWVVMFFIFLSGVNFNLQYKAWKNFDILSIFKSEEFRVYLGLFLGISTLVAVSLYMNDNYGIFSSITHAGYQVISIMTSTGSSSADYIQWSFITKVILFLAVFTGGCASSASGGIKIARWILIFKVMKNELKRVLHPNAILNVKLDNNIVSRDILSQMIMFLCFYVGFVVISIVILALLEQNISIGISASISSIGNIGPGFDAIIGPMASYETLHPISKFVLTCDMIIGRLELIPFLVMFQKDFWNFRFE